MVVRAKRTVTLGLLILLYSLIAPPAAFIGTAIQAEATNGLSTTPSMSLSEAELPSPETFGAPRASLGGELATDFALFYSKFLGIPLEEALVHSPDMLAFYETEFGLDRVEAATQAQLDLLAGELRQLAHQRFPDRWAGSWIEREPTHRIVFSFTQDGQALLDEMVAETGFPAPERLHAADDARFSLSELLDEQYLLSTARGELYPWSGSLETYEGFETRVDEITNRVYVSGPDPERYKTELAGSYDPEMVAFEQRPFSSPACPQGNCDPLIYGGLDLDHPPCSTGFTVTKSNSQESAITTAAHCHDPATPSDTLGYGGQTVTNRPYYQYQDEFDTEIWSLLDAFWQPRDDIWESSTATRDIASVQSYWTMMLNAPVWKVGATTQKTTGVITEFFLELASIPGNEHAIRTSAASQGGDSGGPVYYGGQAMGTVWGVGEGGQDMIFLAADWWDVDSGWQIAKSNPPVPGHDWYLRNSHTGGAADVQWQFGSAPRVPVSGDWDGEGRDQPGVFYGSQRQWDFQGKAVFTYGVDSTVLPLVGDWDYNGADEAGAYRPSEQAFYRQGASTIVFGDPGDLPVAGDWDGGSDDIGVYRPSNQTFYLRRNDGSVINIPFGNPNDLPIRGDWDGGADDVGVYRPSNQTFYLRRSDGTVITVAFGNPNDAPVAGDWNGDGIDTIGVTR